MRELKYIITGTLIALLCCSCAPEHSTGPKGDSGIGTPGNDGNSGVDGRDGSNGHSIIIDTAPSISCAYGGTTVLLATDNDDSLAISPGDVVKSFELCNGTPGADGAPGASAPPTAYTPVGIVDPCGDAPGIYDEVFLRLANGTLLASFSDNASGKNTRFSVITVGNYVTTDGSNCYFSVDSNGNIN